MFKLIVITIALFAGVPSLNMRCGVQAADMPICLKQKVDELVSMAGEALFISKTREEDLGKLTNLFEKIEQMAEDMGYNKWDQQSIQGKYEGIISTSLLRVMPDGKTTLGQATFNNINPNDVKIQVFNTYLELNDKEFKTSSYHTLLDTGLQGYSEVVADVEYALNENKINFLYQKFIEGPSNPEQKQQWIDFFGPYNTEIIDEHGVMTVFLENMPLGYNLVTLSTPEYLILKGYTGYWQLLKRLQ